MDNLLTILERFILIALVVQTISLLCVGFDPRGPAEPHGRFFWLFWVALTGPVALCLYFWRGRNRG